MKQSLRLLAIATFSALGCAASTAQAPIRVVTLDDSRWDPCGGQPRSFASPYFDAARAAMTNPANFGAGGVVARSIVLQFVPEIDDAALAAADVALLIQASVPLTDKELMAINSFALQGGGVLIAENRAATTIGDMVAATARPNGNPSTPTIVDDTSPIITGPFGIAGNNGTTIEKRGYGGSFEDPGPYGQPAIEVTSEMFAGTFLLGPGRIAAFCEEEIFMDLSVPGCASASWRSQSPTMLLNAMAWVAPAPGFAYDPINRRLWGYGSPCNPGVLLEPQLSFLGEPYNPGTLNIRLFSGPDNGSAAILFAGAPAQVPVLGCTFLLGGPVLSIPAALSPSINRAGAGTLLSLPVPAGLSGTLYGQAWLIDASSTTGLTTTGGAAARF